MRLLLGLVIVLGACGADTVALANFRVDASYSTSATSLNGTAGCSVTWTFSANDPGATVYYSVGPGMTATANEWWENGDFRGRGIVHLFVPTGRATDYKLNRVNGTTEIWRKDSGPMQLC